MIRPTSSSIAELVYRSWVAFGALLAALRAVEQERDRWERCAAEMVFVFGVAARTSDDGSVQDSVLALKVPELVEAISAENETLRAALARCEGLVEELRAQAELDEHAYRSGADMVYRTRAKTRKKDADELAAALASREWQGGA